VHFFQQKNYKFYVSVQQIPSSNLQKKNPRLEELYQCHGKISKGEGSGQFSQDEKIRTRNKLKMQELPCGYSSSLGVSYGKFPVLFCASDCVLLPSNNLKNVLEFSLY